mgnify:CR=1 FL=1|tara:strand:- start:444 stop:617 length:174 start_codon:yes stop_codon:yes gene_type:complete
MRTEQLSITFPKNKTHYKKELLRMRNEEQTNISAYLLNLIEKDLGYVGKYFTGESVR